MNIESKKNECFGMALTTKLPKLFGNTAFAMNVKKEQRTEPLLHG